jgi:hypothetical protein
VRTAKAAVINSVTFSPVVQPGVTGAALLAAFAVAGDGLPLADFIRASTATGGRSESAPDTMSAPDTLAEGMK